MQKKYISVIELLGQTIDWLSKKNNCLHISAYPSPHGVPDVMERLPITYISESGIGDTNEVKMRRISISMRTGQRSIEMYMPEFLEMELLRNSDFRYTDAELNCLEQLMMWQVRQWCHIKRDFDMLHLIALLDENELLYELDLDGQQDKALDLITNSYQEKFEFLATSPQTYVQKNVNQYIAAPISTLDIMNIMSTRKTTFYDVDSVYYSRYLLYMPLMAVFSILERQTAKYSHLTLHDYRQYTACIPLDLSAMLEQVGQNFEADETAYSNFSYGFPQRHDDVHVTSDRWLVAKTIHCLLHCMKTEAVERNVPIISEGIIRNISSDEVEKISVLLNKSDLSWDTSEKS